MIRQLSVSNLPFITYSENVIRCLAKINHRMPKFCWPIIVVWLLQQKAFQTFKTPRRNIARGILLKKQTIFSWTQNVFQKLEKQNAQKSPEISTEFFKICSIFFNINHWKLKAVKWKSHQESKANWIQKNNLTIRNKISMDTKAAKKGPKGNRF